MGWLSDGLKKAGEIGKTIVDIGRAGAGGSGPINPSEPIPGRKQPDLPPDVKAGIEKSASSMMTGVTLGIPDAVSAVGHYIENTAHSAGDALSDAERRLREGKVLDAMWHFSMAPMTSSEANLFKAARESALLRAAMEAATSYALGPLGAAAFAAWYTYKDTNNVGLAIRAAIIEGAMAQGTDVLNQEMPINSAETVMNKALAAGALGGLAAAAYGGRAEDLRNGFLSSAGTVVVLDGYHLETGRSLGQDVKEGGKVVIGSVGAFFMKPTIQATPPGKAPPAAEVPKGAKADAKVAPTPPGGLPVFGDWRLVWIPKYVGTGIPAVVLVYVGNSTLYPVGPSKP